MVTLARPLMKNDLFQTCQHGFLSDTFGRSVPFISIRVPVHLAHSTGLNVQMTSSDRLGDREVLAVHDARFAATTFVGRSVKHVVSVLVLRLLKRRRFLLINALGDRA